MAHHFVVGPHKGRTTEDLCGRYDTDRQEVKVSSAAKNQTQGKTWQIPAIVEIQVCEL